MTDMNLNAPAAVTGVSANRALTITILTSAVVSLLIWLANDALGPFTLITQVAGAPRAYPWQLAAANNWSHLTAWAGYIAHQLVSWALIYKAQRAQLSYTTNLQPINIAALLSTLGFVSLHFLQTHLYYDGLAQDVPEWTAMASVIVLLLVVILIENKRRGITFGRSWGGFVSEAGDIARRYHGYYFSWATIYTFWYHPMVFTPGHLVGFFYMFLLFSQGALMYTRAHRNRWWTLTLELLVIAHGVLIAAMHVGGGWQMFAFGLAGIFFVTQIYGLGMSRAATGIALASYVVGTILFYQYRDWENFPRIFLILGGYYVIVPILAGLIVCAARIASQLRGNTGATH